MWALFDAYRRDEEGCKTQICSGAGMGAVMGAGAAAFLEKMKKGTPGNGVPQHPGSPRLRFLASYVTGRCRAI